MMCLEILIRLLKSSVHKSGRGDWFFIQLSRQREATDHLPECEPWLQELLSAASLNEHLVSAATWVRDTGCKACDLCNDPEALDELQAFLHLRKFDAKRLRKAVEKFRQRNAVGDELPHEGRAAEQCEKEGDELKWRKVIQNGPLSSNEACRIGPYTFETCHTSGFFKGIAKLSIGVSCVKFEALQSWVELSRRVDASFVRPISGERAKADLMEYLKEGALRSAHAALASNMHQANILMEKIQNAKVVVFNDLGHAWFNQYEHGYRKMMEAVIDGNHLVFLFEYHDMSAALDHYDDKGVGSDSDD